MDQFLSTYRKDFTWPCVKTVPMRTEKQAHPASHQTRCMCSTKPGGLMLRKGYLDSLDTYDDQWSRLGPMGPLLDPKLYPAKMGPAPEFEITRYDQPNTYLRKLQEKYPCLYNVLQSAPSAELTTRVNQDRLRTTYQVDYGHIDEHPSADYENLLAEAKISPYSKIPYSGQCVPVLDCRAQLRPPDYDDPVQPSSKFIEYRAINDPNGYGRDTYDDFRNGSKKIEHSFRENERVPGGRRESGKDHRDFEYSSRTNGRVPGDPGNGYRDLETNGRVVTNDVAGTRDVRTNGNGVKGVRDPTTEAMKSRNDYKSEGHGGEGDNRGAHSYVDPGGVNVPGGGEKGNGNVGKGGETVTGSGGTGTGTGEDRGSTKKGTTRGFNEEGPGKSKRGGKTMNDEDDSKKPLPPWTSEYQDVIGQTGMSIIRDKLHQHGGRSSGRSFIERIIMKCRS